VGRSEHREQISTDIGAFPARRPSHQSDRNVKALNTREDNPVVPQPSRLKRWLREPLLHFLLIGATLFAIYHWLNPTAPNSNTSRKIELTSDDIRQLEISWTAQWQRPPTPEEMRNLVEDRVREEILYREAIALGFDRGDTIVKRRMAQKMEFLSDDVSDLRYPSLEELKSWYARNGSEFATPARITFRHVYFSPDKRGAQAQDAARQALEKVGKTGDPAKAMTFGDRFMFQDFYADSTSDQVANVFSTKFSEAVVNLKTGCWSGPVESGLGWHLVWVESIAPRGVPAFEEVDLKDIKSQWVSAQRAETKLKLFTAMRARYEIVLPKPFSAPSAPGVAAAATGLDSGPN
jgi:peptidyl-prolyl cis-trans isomerase C